MDLTRTVLTVAQEKEEPNDHFGEIFSLTHHDFPSIGRVSTFLKKRLQQIGIDPEIIRRSAIATFEAEANIVIHATEGWIYYRVSPEELIIVAEDKGPGIADIEKAMEEGYSTASQEIKKMGFGSGMGLPNIRRFSDSFTLLSQAGSGTSLTMKWKIGKG